VRPRRSPRSWRRRLACSRGRRRPGPPRGSAALPAERKKEACLRSRRSGVRTTVPRMYRSGVGFAPYLGGKLDEDAIAAAALVGVGPVALRRGVVAGGCRRGGGLGGGVGVGVVAHGGGAAGSGPGGGDPIKPSAFGDAGKSRAALGGMSGSVETMACGPVPGAWSQAAAAGVLTGGA
jgi:hypothetical protein